MKIKVNLSASSADVEERLDEALENAKKHRAEYIEISYGTQQGELKKRILNFLMKKEYRPLYSRLVKSKEGWGRIFVHFRWS
ncbi:MAG: DNA mismatch repair protein MutS [Candidatus Omnitrophica bacterium]|nr:DNA mismatch repair protein MutS [Candidatus Omnitrophota bacterium]MDD5238650.1 DNA mismatch repair protein MutS [Candidatus Omnitrophota bacterium]